jgi:hypothetical protein
VRPTRSVRVIGRQIGALETTCEPKLIGYRIAVLARRVAAVHQTAQQGEQGRAQLYLVNHDQTRELLQGCTYGLFKCMACKRGAMANPSP